jgi:hypothetical protein
MTNETIYSVLWSHGLEPALVDFLIGLNWHYIIMLTVIMYGLKHTNLLSWYCTLLGKFERYIYWFTSLLLGFSYLIFRIFDGNPIDSFYISSLLRSIIFTVIFSNVFIDIPVFVIKGFGKFIDTKDKKNQNP